MIPCGVNNHMHIRALKLITDTLMWVWVGQPAPQPIAMEALTQGLVNAQEQRISLPPDMQREVLAWAAISKSAQDAQLDAGIKNFLVSKLCRKHIFTDHEDDYNDGRPQPCHIHGAILSPDGTYLFIGSDGYHPIIWDMRTGKKHAVLAGRVTFMAFSADGKYLITVSKWH